MSKRIQVFVSDKNSDLISKMIINNEVYDLNGDMIKTASGLCSYFIDLGIRVFLASKNRTEFNDKEFKKEQYKKILQITQLSKSIINILNQLPEFKDRDLLKEEFNNNEIAKDWIINEHNKFFSD